jgi:hypothetical protein
MNSWQLATDYRLCTVHNKSLGPWQIAHGHVERNTRPHVEVYLYINPHLVIIVCYLCDYLLICYTILHLNRLMHFVDEQSMHPSMHPKTFI